MIFKKNAIKPEPSWFCCSVLSKMYVNNKPWSGYFQVLFQDSSASGKDRFHRCVKFADRYYDAFNVFCRVSARDAMTKVLQRYLAILQ